MGIPQFEEEIFMKNKKAVIIGASSEALHTIQKAKEHGLEVIALDGNPNAEGLKAADKALVVDISDEQKTIEAVKREEADFVLTVPIGRYLTTIGAVNDALELPGIGKEEAVSCTDKFLFHQKLAKKDLRKCRCYAINKEQEVLGENGMVSFPAILKPRYGSGSRGIHMLFDKEQLQEAFEAVRGEAYVLEECVQGEEYGVDGAVIHGEFCLILLRKKENTPPPARQAVAYYSVQPKDAFYQQVLEYMKEVTATLGLSECLLHADVIQSQNGPFVIELSARPSGHNLHNLFTPLCTGIDMAEEYVKYQMGQPYSFVPEQTKQMMIHYFDMQGVVKKVPDEMQIKECLKNVECTLVIYQCNLKEGEVLEPVSDGHSIMGRGFFVLEGKKESALKKGVEEIKKLFL